MYISENIIFCECSQNLPDSYLLCSDRPINEIIAPNFQNQRAATSNQFSGMSSEDFTYEDYEEVRRKLVLIIHVNLKKEDKHFLLSFSNATPDWSLYDFERFPVVQWKLRHLKILKETNPEKHREQYEALRKKLGL